MDVAELLLVHNFTGIILDDQRKFLGSGIFKFHTENQAVVIRSDVIYSYLLFGEVGRFLVVVDALGIAGQRAGND
jgi:hypothetical protein